MTPLKTTRSKVTAVAAGAVAGIALTAGALAGFPGASAADIPTATPTPKANGVQPNLGVPPGLRGPRHRALGLGIRGDKAALAKKLGVSTDKLKAALKKVRADLRASRATPPKAGTRPDPKVLREQFVTALAKELGVSSTKIDAALTDLRAVHRAERAAAFRARLDQAVKDGKLTRAEADAVLKAAKAGIIGMGGPRHP
jgi:hypothetical protein